MGKLRISGLCGLGPSLVILDQGPFFSASQGGEGWGAAQEKFACFDAVIHRNYLRGFLFYFSTAARSLQVVVHLIRWGLYKRNSIEEGL